MLNAARQLVEDFLSTIIFLAVFWLSGSIPIAVGVAIAVAIAQFLRLRLQGRKLDIMQWMSLGLVVGLGSVALLTADPRFILIKPALVHFVIAAVMLRRGWMQRYLPDRLPAMMPERVVILSGYGWAAFMAALGVAILAVAALFPFTIAAWFIGVGVMGLTIAAFLVQYLVFRIAIIRRLRAAAATPGAPSPG